MEIKIIIRILLLGMVCTSMAYAEDFVLLVHPAGSVFQDVIKGIKDEVSQDMTVRELIVDKKTSVNDLMSTIKTHTPNAVVLMDNSSINLFHKFRENGGAWAEKIPGLALVGISIDNAIATVKNMRGIAYEIPAITSLVNLRAISKKPLKTVGVVHRAFMKNMVDMNVKLCSGEKFTFKTMQLDNEGNALYYEKAVKKALDTLVNIMKVDVIWIPIDNRLLTLDIIQKVWIPMLSAKKIPAIIDVEKLIDPNINFGTFASIPDHVALGGQAASMLFDLKKLNWVYNDSLCTKVERLITVEKALNLPQAKKYLGVKDELLDKIDIMLK